MTATMKQRVQPRHRLLLGEPLRPLWEAGSVEVFMDVWADCLESESLCLLSIRPRPDNNCSLSLAHHHVSHNTALGVFPRDLGAHNLMLTPGSANRTIVSFLSDWDLEATGDDIPVKPLHHRTGAAAFTFRATDLLVPRPAPRLYRHDLESFFYILIWAALHYDFKHKTRTSRVHSVVRKWTSSDMELAQNRKICLVLSNVYGIDEIIAHISPQCQALLVPWIQVIWDLFDEGNADCRTYRKMSHTGNAAVWDNKTFGGWITFEKFMEAIGRTPRLEDSAPAC